MSNLERLLFPTRFDNLSFPELKRVLDLAGAGLRHVILLNVLDRDEVGFVPFGGFDKELAEELKEKALLAFADWEGLIEARGLTWAKEVVVGNPEAKILEVAERENAGLIVVGRTNTLSDAFYPTGVDFGVIRHSPVPTLLFPPAPAGRECGDPPLFFHLLQAVDFSQVCGTTTTLVASLAPVVGRVSLLHVIAPDEVDGLTAGEVEALNAERYDLLEELAACYRGAGVSVETHLLMGDASAEILRFGSERGCSAIAVGTRRVHGIKEMVLGSVSHEVAVKSDLPVLLVPCGG